MQKIIASLYEIEKEIGSGGGGVVYLANHLRLNKKVVLKADRRVLSAKPEVLRREVEALKNLSHTYIPQVYDFVEEDGFVFTVMDYIEGESFDKILKRGERFSQAQVIEWACELLEAISYLHGRPPRGILHSDIKPANIMLTPENDIRLIDFNIALALGEEGAVKVGYSQGYASPEHYGSDYRHQETVHLDAETELAAETEILSEKAAATEILSDRSQNRQSHSISSYSKKILLDTRSDIYSLGATLYHILTGTRPARSVEDMIPISRTEFSPAVVDIIEKAMNPNPDLRYQTAQDMLTALKSLHENDSRSKRLKKITLLTSIFLGILFLSGGGMALTGLKQMERLQSAYVLAEYSENALLSGNVEQAVALALEALPADPGIFDPPYTAEAQKALTDALGVYDLTGGFRALRTQELPSEPLKMALSDSGKQLAAFYAWETIVIDTETGEQKSLLPTIESALADCKFVGEDILLYAAPEGLTAWSIPENQLLWQGKPTAHITVSQDNRRVAAIYKDETQAYVYDMQTGEIINTISFNGKYQSVAANDRLADPGDNLLALNHDGTLMAVSFADGSLMVFDLEGTGGDLELFDTSSYRHFEGGFYEKYLAFSATNTQESIFAVVDTEEAVQTGGFAAQSPFQVQTDENGIYLALEQVLVKIDPETGAQQEAAYTPQFITGFGVGSEYSLVAVENTAYVFDRGANQVGLVELDEPCNFTLAAGEYAVIGSLNSPTVRILKLKQYPEAEIFSYDPSYQHNEARLSADGSTVMLFRYDEFRIYEAGGELLIQVQIPDAEQIYDQQYRRDENGSYLEVIYNDGTVRTYSAMDGSLLAQSQQEKPNLTLYEEFFTDNLKITAPLHETPAAYDRHTGEMLRELEPDAYLTYVTQVDDGIITEYISSTGERYGLLLDEQCQTLAKLPNLCDIMPEGELIFDDPSGKLRKTRIYSLPELLALAE